MHSDTSQSAGHVPPRQRRSRETQEKLLAAARRLIAERGREAPTVTEIMDAAGCSVGGFYARFPGGRNALYELLERRLFEASIDCWSDFFSSARRREESLAEVVGGMVALLVQRYRDDRALLRELFLHWRREPPSGDVGAAAKRQADILTSLLTGELGERREEFRHPDPERAARSILNLLQAMLNEHVLFGGEGAGAAASGEESSGDEQRGADPDPSAGPEPDELQRDLVHAILGILGASVPSRDEKEAGTS